MHSGCALACTWQFTLSPHPSPLCPSLYLAVHLKP